MNIVETFAPLWRVVVRPRRTIAALLDRPGFGRALSVVLVFGVLVGLLFLCSAMWHDFPPTGEEFKVWIAAYGEGSMVPFVNVPIGSYRLFLAEIMVPFALAMWLLMAGTARVIGGLMDGKGSFDDYLRTFAYTFFAWWLIAQAADIAFSALAGARLTPMLRGDYGSGWRALAVVYPPAVWVGALTMGGVYNAIAAKISESFGWAKAAVIGAVTLAWPIVMISALVR